MLPKRIYRNNEIGLIKENSEDKMDELTVFNVRFQLGMLEVSLLWQVLLYGVSALFFLN